MKLVVFFSRGMSLAGWRRAGILERELALYRALLPQLQHLAFVTYGGADDMQGASSLPGVEVLVNRWHLPANLYSVLAPWIHRRTLRRATIFKTNQINGAWSALIAKRLFHKALLVRCGFLWSDFMARLHSGSWRHNVATWLERTIFRAADAVIVAAEADRRTIVDRYALAQSRVHVVPNYVETELFRPMPELRREPGRVLFIGRLDEQKNVAALIEAVGGLPHVTLTIVGDGLLRASLEAAARHLGARVTFLGTRPHGELPVLLNQASVFVLPSHYEGNPKALVEAMSCGLPVVGADAPGIREIVVHGQTGVLCGTSAGEIRAALGDLLADAALREHVGAGAAAYVRSHCSVESAVARELALYGTLAEGRA